LLTTKRRSSSEERRIEPMNFKEPEVMELGEARELIQELPLPPEEEGPVGMRTRNAVAIYFTEE
jgi:hypothetical protein